MKSAQSTLRPTKHTIKTHQNFPKIQVGLFVKEFLSIEKSKFHEKMKSRKVEVHCAYCCRVTTFGTHVVHVVGKTDKKYYYGNIAQKSATLDQKFQKADSAFFSLYSFLSLPRDINQRR